jgi:hypothetical protein
MTHYGIGFTPVNELARLPVRLLPQMEIYKDHHIHAARSARGNLLGDQLSRQPHQPGSAWRGITASTAGC